MLYSSSNLILLWWPFCSLIAAIFAIDKKEGFWGTLVISLFFSPLAGILCAYISGDKPPKNKPITSNQH